MKLQYIAIALIIAAFGYMMIYGSVTEAMDVTEDIQTERPSDYPHVILGGGCFWCVESEFRAKDGVLYTRAGYAGGELENPTYGDITTGKTGHAEVVEITYDPEKLSYEELIRYFLTSAHDPTQLNRQGVDVGPQYRSIIFYSNEEEKQTAQALIEELDASGLYQNPIVTQVEPEGKFWLAEEYHQQYYEKYQKKTGARHLRVILKEQRKAKKALKDQ